MIDIVISLFVLVFGLLVGSFLNVVILRLPQGKSIVFPASHCPSCSAGIAWYDNIPLLSFLRLRGRCRACLGLFRRLAAFIQHRLRSFRSLPGCFGNEAMVVG